jgi:hypothetical protein
VKQNEKNKKEQKQRSEAHKTNKTKTTEQKEQQERTVRAYIDAGLSQIKREHRYSAMSVHLKSSQNSSIMVDAGLSQKHKSTVLVLFRFISEQAKEDRKETKAKKRNQHSAGNESKQSKKHLKYKLN